MIRRFVTLRRPGAGLRCRRGRWLNLMAVSSIVAALAGLAFPHAGDWAAHILDHAPITAIWPAQRHPSPAARHIKHIVFILAENRSFDNVFGRFPGADGATQATVAVSGRDMTTPLLPEPYYLWHDLGHDLHDAQVAINHGKMDGFSHETYSDIFGDKAAYQQLLPRDVPNLYAYARHFTLADRTFASVPGSTFPAHLHTVAAQDGGVISNPQNSTNAWGCDAVRGTYVLVQQARGQIGKSFPCFTYTTLTDVLNKAHISWTYYAAPPSDLGYIWSTLDAFKQVRQTSQWRDRVRDERSFAGDARAGRLPAFSWLTPRAAESMHPPAPVCPGENWVVRAINAVMHGPDWPSTLIVLAWDDWGGYYDHVAPPAIHNGNYGPRVPLLLISPYARPGDVTHTVYTFESVLKTAEALWGLAPLTTLDRAAPDLLGSLSFTHKPTPPLLLRQRPCPPPLTRTQFHTYLDQQLQHVLSQELDLSPSQIAALHRTATLLQIARVHHVKSSALSSALKTVAGAGAGGEVLLQLIKPQDAGRETYLAMRRIDQLLQAAPGAPLFR
jgi:phospholipase C